MGGEGVTVCVSERERSSEEIKGEGHSRSVQYEAGSRTASRVCRSEFLPEFVTAARRLKLAWRSTLANSFATGGWYHS